MNCEGIQNKDRDTYQRRGFCFAQAKENLKNTKGYLLIFVNEYTDR